MDLNSILDLISLILKSNNVKSQSALLKIFKIYDLERTKLDKSILFLQKKKIFK